MKKNALLLLTCLAICFGVEAIGGLLTNFGVHDWYPTLKKPSFTPPPQVFAPVWTILYFLMAVSLWLVILANNKKGQSSPFPYVLFGVQLFLNLIWSGLFFTLRNPYLALIDIMALWFAIGMTIVAFWPISRFAALLLIPYWAWVSYAVVLNASIHVLN